jgi:hypothetical protein
MPRLVTASLIALAVAASPALAQPSGTAARPPAGGAAVPVPVPSPPPPSPPPTTNPPPTTTPPVTTTPPETTPPETAPVNQPVQQTQAPPPAPIELSPDVPYPNGLGDPNENFARADNDRDGGGFPWGLLGLLGLLGLVPWLRGGPKTIYVERERAEQDPNRPRE